VNVLAIEPTREALQRSGMMEDTARGIAQVLARLGDRERSDLAAALLSSGVLAEPEDSPPVRSLAEYLENPELLLPPEATVPRFAWMGRVTLLVGREKSGKSTLAVCAASALTRGGKFLGEGAMRGTVLWVGVEEHPGDLARKAVAFEADPETFLVLQRVENPLRDLEDAIRRETPELVVVDTLPSFLGAMRIESGDAAGWTAVMAEFVRMARAYSCAMVLLHHASKASGEARDSTAITANADVILTVKEDAGDTDLRRVETRGRFHVEPFAYLLHGDPMQGKAGCASIRPAGVPLSIEGQILAFIERHPGCGTSEVRSAVQGRAEEVSLTLTRLERSRQIQNRRSGQKNCFSLIPQEPSGNGAERVGTGTGTSHSRNGSESNPGAQDSGAPAGAGDRGGDVAPKGHTPKPPGTGTAQRGLGAALGPLDDPWSGSEAGR